MDRVVERRLPKMLSFFGGLMTSTNLPVACLQWNITRGCFRQLALGDLSNLRFYRVTTTSHRLQLFWIAGRASVGHATYELLDKCHRYAMILGGRERRPCCCADSSVLSACSRTACAIPTCTAFCGLGTGRRISYVRAKQVLPFLGGIPQVVFFHNSSVADPTQWGRRMVMSSREPNAGLSADTLKSCRQLRNAAHASSSLTEAHREDNAAGQHVPSFHADESEIFKSTRITKQVLPFTSGVKPAGETGLFDPVRTASYVPQPEQATEPRRGKKTSRGKALLIFLVCSCSPVVLLAALFASMVETRKAEQELAFQTMESEVDYLRAASDLVSTTTLCYCLPTTEPNGTAHNAVFVEPHLPEARLLRLPEVESVPGLKGNSVTDLLLGEKSDFSLPFNFIHFALARSSPAAASLQGGKKVSLFYVNPRNGVTLLLSGFAAVVLSTKQRRHYWRNKWEATLPGKDSKEYLLVKFVPDTLQLSFPPRLAPAEKYTWCSPVLRRVVTDSDISWVLTPKAKPKEDASG